MYADDDAPWFKEAFTQISGVEHHINTQAAFWIDAFGGGRQYHGGAFPPSPGRAPCFLSFHPLVRATSSLPRRPSTAPSDPLGIRHVLMKDLTLTHTLPPPPTAWPGNMQVTDGSTFTIPTTLRR